MSDRDIEAVIDEAAGWMAKLQSGGCGEQDYRQFQSWRASHPRHAEIFDRLAGGIGSLKSPALAGVGSERLLEILNAPSSRRRFLRGALGVTGVVTVSAIAGKAATSGLSWPGDLSTSTAERRDFALADGSGLVLNARSRVTPKFTDDRRGLRFHHGELLLTVAEDPKRSFVVETDAAQLNGATPCRFVLCTHADDSYGITVIDGEVQAATHSGKRYRLRAAETARFDSNGAFEASRANSDAAAWLNGLLEVDDRSLGEVVDALRDYRRGMLRVSPEAARLRISGIFSLDDTERTLKQLARALPIQIARYSDYWITIDLRA